MSSSTTESLRRAGFWRRFLSALLDVTIVGAPFQIVVAILFAATAGHVQVTNSGFVVKSCHGRAAIPAGLSPPPPHDANFATDCVYSFFGAPTGRTLFVGRTEKQGTVTKTVFRTYMVDAAGEPVQGVSVDIYVLLALLAYLIGLTTTQGRTLGDRMVRIRAIDVAHPLATGVPWRKAALRYAAMTTGYLPVLALLLAVAVTGDVEDMVIGPMAYGLIAGLIISAIWVLTLIVQIARKRDPFYDRWAGTAVIRP